MGSDLLNVSANQRVDLVDFEFLADEGLQANIREPNANLMTDPSKQRAWILEGFALSNPAGEQLQVTKGRAILGSREGALVNYGMLTVEGDASKTIDMGVLSDNVAWGAYIRFEYTDGDSASRIFWNPAGTGSELSQSVPTRRLANWSLRVELSNPGSEWLKIATIDNTGGFLVITDERPFFFEGRPSASYASGWSTDGGGGANDRNADRANYGVFDFQTFSSSIRQSLEDIKGRGLRRWWDKGIGGMNVGFDTDPTEDRIGLGSTDTYWDGTAAAQRLQLTNNTYFDATTDAELLQVRVNFGLYYDGTDPALIFDGSNDKILYDRSANQYLHEIGGTTEMLLGTDGLRIANGLYVGDTGVAPTDNDITAAADIIAGNYLYANSGRLYLGTDDRMSWDGTNWTFHLNNTEEARLSANGLAIANGLYVGSATGTPTDNDLYVEADGIIAAGLSVGHTGAPSADTVSVGASTFLMDYNSGNPRLKWSGSTINYWHHDATKDRWQVWADSFPTAGTATLQMEFGKGHDQDLAPAGTQDTLIRCDGILEIHKDYSSYLDPLYLDVNSATNYWHRTSLRGGAVGQNVGFPAIRLVGDANGPVMEFWSEDTINDNNVGLRGAIGMVNGVNNEFCISTCQENSDMEMYGHRILTLHGSTSEYENYINEIFNDQQWIGGWEYDVISTYEFGMLYVGFYADQGLIELTGTTVGNGPTVTANQCQVFGKKVGSYAEVHVKDGNNVVTQISPHDPETREWVFNSLDGQTGVRKRVNMERLVALVEQLSGEQLMEVTQEAPIV